VSTQPEDSPLEISPPTRSESPNTDDMAPGEADRVAATVKPAGHVEDARDPKHDAPWPAPVGGGSGY